MASDTICIGQRQACALRATRLGSDCSPVEGEDNAVVTTALVTANLDPDIEEGTNFEPKNACDEILWTAEEPSKIKRLTGDIELGVFDYELIELLTDCSLLVGAAGSPWEDKNIGVAYPGPQTASTYGVALEIWVKAQATGNTGPCGPAGTHPPYIRHVFPRVLLTPSGRTFENDVAMFRASMKASANSQWGEGPWGDWPATTGIPSTSPHAEFFDDALPATACGYIEVPAGS